MNLLCCHVSHHLLKLLGRGVAQLLDARKLLEEEGGLHFSHSWDLLHSLHQGGLGERGPLLLQERVPPGLFGLLFNLNHRLKGKRSS